MVNYREMPHAPGIYRITNKVNGKIYVGQAKDISKRVKNHSYNDGRKKNARFDYILYEAVRKYGINNFIADVLEITPSDDLLTLNKYEYYWFIVLGAHISVGHGYNVLIPGCWGNIISQLSPEKQKERSRKLSIANKGKQPSPETRKRLSIAGKGRKQSSEWVEKRISKMRGRPSSLKGKKRPDLPPFILSPEDQKKAFLANPRTVCLKFTNRRTEEVKYFYGCQEASRYFNIHRTTLTDVIIRGEIPKKGLKKKFFDTWKWEIILKEILFQNRPDLM